jgi:hypothetical protein
LIDLGIFEPLKPVPDHLGEKEPLRMQWFRGVHEKYTD